MYPEIMVMPMREELARLGIKETRTPDEVDNAVKQPGTTMVVPGSLTALSTSSAVRVSLIPRRVSSSRIGMTMISGYIRYPPNIYFT